MQITKEWSNPKVYSNGRIHYYQINQSEVAKQSKELCNKYKDLITNWINEN